jgi:ribosomal protein S18 acetylase RimI-like enzyme
MEAYRTRPLKEQDIESIIAIDALLTGGSGPDRAGFWRGLLSLYAEPTSGEPAVLQSPCLCAVAEAAGDQTTPPGAVAGFIIGDVQSWQFGIPRRGRIVAIGVHPSHRRSGVATLLAGSLLKTFRKMGLPFVHCLARPGDPLGDFFRSLGFTASEFELLEKPL